MKQMVLSSKIFICCGIVLLTILIFLVYSIKNYEKENSKKTSMVSVRDDEINRLRQENDELKKTLAETKLQNSNFKASLGNITKETQEQETQELKQPLKETKINDEKIESPNASLNEKNPLKNSYDPNLMASPDNIAKEIRKLRHRLRETKIRDEKIRSPNAKLNKKNPIKKSYDPNLVNSLLAQFKSSTNADEKVKLLKSLGEMSLEQDPAVIKMVQDALDDPDSEVGYAAMQLLEGYNTPEILSAVAKALKVGNEETRLEALQNLSGIEDPMVGVLLSQALNDTSENVRSTAFDMFEERPDSEQISVLQNGLNSPYDDIKTQVVQKLEGRSDHKAVEILIEGLKDTNPDFRGEVNTSLSSLFDKEFKSYKEAKDWWNQNKSKYDAELSEITP